MNIIKKITYILALGAVLFTAASCSDPDDELTSVEYDRLFKPTSFEAVVKNKVNVRLLWECLSKPDSYTVQLFANDENMNFEGDPTLEFTDVTSSPYNIEGLADETTYSVRIKAVGASKESHWATAVFQTAAEQIFASVTDDDITATTVTLKWTPGADVDVIEITGGKEETYTLSDEEKQNGTATITGLTEDTKYTFTIKNSVKNRGKVTVSTMPNYTAAYPGSDLQELIDATEDGGTLMLLPAKDDESNNKFIYTDADGKEITKELTISKKITVRCMDSKPVTARLKFVLDGTTGFNLENIKFEGTSSDALIKVVNCNGSVSVNKVDVTGYANFMTAPEGVAGAIDEFNVTNSYFHDMCAGKRFIDSQKTTYTLSKFNMNYCTIANSCKGSDFIRFDYLPITINFEHNTLYKVEATSKGLFYVRSKTAGDRLFTLNVNNNVFAELSEGVFFSQDSKTDNVNFSKNCYFNAGTLSNNVDGGKGKVFDESGTGVTLDPMFKDAANGDFTITNETVIDKHMGNISE